MKFISRTLNADARQSVLFVFVPILSAVAPLLVLPSVTRSYGAGGLIAITVGQSIGSAFGVLVEMGWGLDGPQRVARASRKYRGELYILAILTKFIVWVPTATAAAFAAIIVTSQHESAAALTAIGMTGAGLTPVWFFIGSGKPLWILVGDTVPRLLLLAAAAVAIWYGAPLMIFPLFLILSSAVPPLIGMFYSGSTISHFLRYRTQYLWIVFRSQIQPLQARIFSSLYIALPITIVAIAAPAHSAVFSAIERIERMALAVLQAVPNSMQRWIGSAPTKLERIGRADRAILWNGMVGVVASLVYVGVSPPMAHYLFSGVVDVPISAVIASSFVIFLTCISRATGGLALVSRGRVSSITRSAILGAVVGLPAIFFLSKTYGTTGGFLGEAMAELVVLSTQLLQIRRDKMGKSKKTGGNMRKRYGSAKSDRQLERLAK